MKVKDNERQGKKPRNPLYQIFPRCMFTHFYLCEDKLDEAFLSVVVKITDKKKSENVIDADNLCNPSACNLKTFYHSD
jgi:hypothetical protein